MQNLSYSHKLKNDLITLSLWAKIVSIIAFISAALSIMVSFRTGNVVAGLISSGISVAINLYLFRFSNKMKTALETTNQEESYYAWKNLKSYFLIYGVFSIIAIVIVVFAFLAGGDEIIKMLRRGRF